MKIKRRNTPDRTRYRWNPAYTEQSVSDARKFLNEVQYEHAVQLALTLCEEDDPTHAVLLDVDAIDEFHEIRDKGGVLGKINLRIYFFVHAELKMVVVLGAWKKEVEGKTPARIIKRMKWRKRAAEEALRENSATRGVPLAREERKGRL